MQHLPDEEVLVTSNQDTIVLTNQRIQMSDKEWGKTYQITIFLENISSIEVLYKSNPLFLVIAGLCLLFGLLALPQAQANGSNISIGGFVVGIIFLILWFFSRSRQVSIASNGGSKLHFRVDGMSAPEVTDFIDKVIHAKAIRTVKLLNI